MKSVGYLKLAATIAVLSGLGTGSAHACLTCMGADSTTGPALNGAIFFMLGTLGTVFTGIGAVAFTFWRRSRSPMPAHAELSSSLSSVGQNASSI